MTIAEVSRMFEISADTLRYYERIGLLPAVPRTPDGIRDNGEKDLGWIAFIKCMRDCRLKLWSCFSREMPPHRHGWIRKSKAMRTSLQERRNS